MSISRLGNNKRRTRKDDPENPGVRFLYSEAVAKVLRKYGPCVNMVRKRYPSSYLYRDNTDLNLNHLPCLGQHYEEIPVSRSTPDVATTAKSLPDHLSDGRKRTTTFSLPHINPSAKLMPKRGIKMIDGHKVVPEGLAPPGGYHRHCFERSYDEHGYTFVTDRRSAYTSRRLPSAFGTPLPCTFSNRPIIEKMWTDRIPQCRDSTR